MALFFRSLSEFYALVFSLVSRGLKSFDMQTIRALMQKKRTVTGVARSHYL